MLLLPVAIAIPTFGVLFYLYRKFYSHRFFKRIGLPGPAPHWLYGNMKELWVKGERHRVIQAWSQKYGPFFGYYEGANPVIVTSSIEAVEQICVKQYSNFQGHRLSLIQPDPRTDMSSYTFSVNVFFAWGQHWKRLRSILNPSFSTGKLKSYMPLIRKSQISLLKALERNSENSQTINIHEQYQFMTIDVIAEAAFGLELDSLGTGGKNNRILKLIQDILMLNQGAPPFWLLNVFSELLTPAVYLIKWFSELQLGGPVTVINEITRLCDSIVKQRAGDPSLRRNDLLQALIDSSELANSDDTKSETSQTLLTRNEVLAQAMTLFFAGTETTSTALGFAAYLLAKNQDVQEKLYQQIATLFKDGENTEVDYDAVMSLTYLDWVCNEVLRMYPIAAFVVNRFVMEDTQVCGVTIPKQCANVIVDMYSIHNNPDLWGPVDPATFYPERFAPEYSANRPNAAFLPFGYGPRLCVGMRLGQLEMKLTLANVLYRYRLLEPPGGFPPNGLPVTVEAAITPADGVHVILERRPR